MKPPEEIKRELVLQWLTKADNDLIAARILLKTPSSLGGIIGFHAQQAAKKYLKAYLTSIQVDFPKTHNIGALIVLISKQDEMLAGELKPVMILSRYAVEGRYPADIPEICDRETEEALELAEKAGSIILAKLGLRPN